MSGTVARRPSVLTNGKKELSAFVDSSLFLLTLVTICDTGVQHLRSRKVFVDFTDGICVLNSNQKAFGVSGCFLGCFFKYFAKPYSPSGDIEMEFFLQVPSV